MQLLRKGCFRWRRCELSSVHRVGGEVMGQVVYRWAAWLLFKGCVVLKGTVGSGQLGSWQVKSTHTTGKTENLSAPR